MHSCRGSNLKATSNLSIAKSFLVYFHDTLLVLFHIFSSFRIYLFIARLTITKYAFRSYALSKDAVHRCTPNSIRRKINQGTDALELKSIQLCDGQIKSAQPNSLQYKLNHFNLNWLKLVLSIPHESS
uniref:Uncharacterized protein n=1 Tax=Parascaris univalens TaxID=6257 RepID=A0A915CHY5_PARUN